MRSRTLTVVILILAALGAFSTPALATIQYSYCYSGCSNTNSGMTYGAFQAVTSGLTFPLSPITFASANLDANGIYTDPTTGAIFTGYNGTTQQALSISGTSLALTGTNGTDRPIEITLPGNVYAVGMFLSSTSGFVDIYSDFIATLAAFNTGAADYEIQVSNSGSSAFFGLVSTTPLTRLVLGTPIGSSNNPFRIVDFQLGIQQPAPPPTDTPEATTFALIGGGLLVLRFLRKPAFGRLTQRSAAS